MTRKRSLSGTIFDSFNNLFFILLACTTVYPFLYLFTLSLSPADASFATIRIIPEKVTLFNYTTVLSHNLISTGFTNSLVRTVLGTVLSVIVTIMTAYVLSKRYLPHRTFWTILVTFTMFFSGGLIPAYLLVKNLGLMNSMWALILPGLIQTFQLIVARNFLMTIPEALEESAKIDGAGEFTVLFKIVIPLSLPIIATLSLWTAVWHWNAWFDSLIYLSDAKKQVLMVVMRNVVLAGQMPDVDPTFDQAVNPETIKAATVMVTTIPIIIVYPFLQKYFVKGMLIGSVKG